MQPESPPKKTPLWDLHQELGARMAAFAGWDMPLRYGSEQAEHEWTRSAAGLFDVGHMAVVDVLGEAGAADTAGAADGSATPDGATATWLETLVPAGIAELAAGEMVYTMLTTPQGGVLDDLVVSHLGDRFRLVLNAGRAQVDLAHLQQHADTGSVQVSHREDLVVLALQGPLAADVLAELEQTGLGQAGTDQTSTTSALSFMQTTLCDAAQIANVSCTVSRSGYTGEDGFELTVPASSAAAVARALLADPNVAPIGLVARDSLRLEAGLCLWGNDLIEQTTPIEAGLRWSIPAHRRTADASYLGAAVIAQQIADKPERRRVGIAATGRRPIREGAELFLPDSTAANGATESIGYVTSGGVGPSVGRPVAMGYVRTDCAKPGTDLMAEVRDGKHAPCKVEKLPFVAHKYRR